MRPERGSSAPANPRSLRRGILVRVALPTALVLMAGSAYDVVTGVGPATRAYDQALLATALALAPHVASEVGTPRFVLPPAAEDVIRSDRYDRIFFAVRTLEGGPVGGDADMPSFALPIGEQRYYADATMRGEPVRVAVARLPTAAGDLQFLVAETRAKRERTTREYLSNLLVVDLLVLAAVALAVIYGVDRGLAPLARLTRELKARSDRDLRALNAAGAPDELRPFVDEINSLFSRLDAAAATRNRFVANAAHQLRTPLAGLKTQLELARTDPLPPGAEGPMARAYEACVRMARMTGQLLALARLEPESAGQAAHGPLDLAEMAGASVDDWVHAAMAADVDLGFELAPAGVRGDATMLRELASNLVDNALRYAGPGAHVTLRTGVDAQGVAFLEVEDDGPGIPGGERDRVLERFYRVAGSPGPGSGLGLAIVAEIAAAHGARLSLAPGLPSRTRPQEHGLRATVRFAGDLTRS